MSAKSKSKSNVHPARAITRPEDLARLLGLNGKLVRGYLRATFPRPIEAKNTSWSLSSDQAIATFDHFAKRNQPQADQASDA